MAATHVARRLWHRLEALHAVVYFCPESREAFARLGLKGFWMGYFAARAAPMGPVGAGVVEATFYSFHPSRVQRAVPDAWAFATPEAVIGARSGAAATSLRRLITSEMAETTAARALPLLDTLVDAARTSGRPLFAGNKSVPRPDDPVGALWQSATALREHRGDGHVALLTAAGLSGVEALVLFSLSEEIAPPVFKESRAWSDEEWDEATDDLCSRGLVSRAGGLTPAGAELRGTVEQQTDELASQPFAALRDGSLDVLLRILEPAAQAVMARGEIPLPNPMGMPRLDRRSADHRQTGAE